MSRESDTDLKALYAEVFKCLLRGDPHFCHHYIFSRFHDITIPFDSWQEEVEAIARSSNLEERKIKEWYYDRCRKCRKHCNDRIIIPENGDPFWSIRDYYNHKIITRKTPLSRQQKAQETKEKSDTYDIDTLTQRLCERLFAENMAKKADDGVNYVFRGGKSLYAYIALQVAEETHLGHIPWKSFCRFLSLDASSKTLDKGTRRTLKKTASEIKNMKRNKPEGHAVIDSIVDELRRNQG